MHPRLRFSRTSSAEALLRSWDRRVTAEVEPGHFETVEATLRPAEGELRAGSKPLFVLQDPERNKYILKVAEPALMAAEQAAYRLRKLGGRPAVPARIIDLDIEGCGHTHGLLKPFIRFDHQRELPTDTSQWTSLQRNAIVREHAWDWFLDNLDTNVSQFALIGSVGYPLNIDWDRAFADDGKSEFSRFAKYRVTLPNTLTFVYADYVEARVDLDLKILAHEASLIQNLPEARVESILSEYARVRFEDPAATEVFVRRLMMRKRSIEPEVAHFIRRLREERRQISGSASVAFWQRPRVAATVVWNHWQVVLNVVQRGAVGRAARHVLTRFRAKSAGVPLDIETIDPKPAAPVPDPDVGRTSPL